MKTIYPILLLILIVQFCKGVDYSAINPPDVYIFPTPKSFQLSGSQYSTGQYLNIIKPKNLSTAELAAIEDLTGEMQKKGISATVIDEKFYAAYPSGVFILPATAGQARLIDSILTLDGKTVTPTSPGSQGYIIGDVLDGNKRVFFVAGSDDKGVLYGVHSWVQLVKKINGIGQIYQAEVTDYPSFQGRMCSSGSEYSECTLDRMKWLVKLKFNYSFYGGDWDDGTRNSWALKRNLRLGCTSSYYFHYQLPVPDHICIAPGDYFSKNCWADPAQISAYQSAWQSICQRGTTFLGWHDMTDAGYWPRYLEYWANRCSYCSTSYPQSTPLTADAVRFQMMVNIKQQANPSAILGITIPCYFDNPDSFADMRTYLQTIGQSVPADTMFIVENRSPAQALAYKTYTNRPLIMYLYPFNGAPRNWTNRFALAPSYLGKCDIWFYCVGHREDDLLLAGAAEYSWNTNLPTDDNYLLTNFVPRALKYLYGDGWRCMADWFTMQIDETEIRNTWNLSDLSTIRSQLSKISSSMEYVKSKISSDPEALASMTENFETIQKLNILSNYRIAISNLRDLLPVITTAAQTDDRVLTYNTYKQMLPYLSQLRDMNSIYAEEIDENTELSHIPATIKTLERDLKIYRQCSNGTINPSNRSALWNIGTFDHSQDEYEGYVNGENYVFRSGIDDEKDFLDYQMSDHTSSIVFSGDLSNGALLKVSFKGAGFYIDIDGQRVAFTYLGTSHTSSSYEAMWIALPPMPESNHTMTITTYPGQRNYFDALSLYNGQEPVGTGQHLEKVTVAPAPYWGYINCGYAYAQDTPPAGIYAKAIGQTFVTPTVNAGERLKLSGFSTVFTGSANYSYGQTKFTLQSWKAANNMPDGIIYEYTTQDDVYHIGDRSDIRVTGSNWMHNGDNPVNKDWLFRNWDLGTNELAGNTMYYWEVEVLKNVYPLSGNVMDYIRLGWGATTSGSSSGNWTNGAAYQRYSDGSVAQILPQYGPCDINFKMEFEIISDSQQALDCNERWSQRRGDLEDFNRDCEINFEDFVSLAQNWMQNNEPY